MSSKRLKKRSKSKKKSKIPHNLPASMHKKSKGMLAPAPISNAQIQKLDKANKNKSLFTRFVSPDRVKMAHKSESLSNSMTGILNNSHLPQYYHLKNQKQMGESNQSLRDSHHRQTRKEEKRSNQTFESKIGNLHHRRRSTGTNHYPKYHLKNSYEHPNIELSIDQNQFSSVGGKQPMTTTSARSRREMEWKRETSYKPLKTLSKKKSVVRKRGSVQEERKNEYKKLKQMKKITKILSTMKTSDQEFGHSMDISSGTHTLEVPEMGTARIDS